MLTPAENFKDKKITLVGLGLLGRGLGDARFLADAGADLIVTDLKSEAELEEAAVQIRQYQNVTLRLGEHRYEDFEDRDLILVAAGVPQDSPYLAHAREHNIPISMSALQLVELSGLPAIGVTGTRGKSTVTQLIHHTLQQAGKQSLLGGNVRGVSNLQLLREVSGAEVLVLELDSWQLQAFGWAERSPHIAVFTNFFEDHLNYYGSMEAYFADKANIYKWQKPGDVLIAGEQVATEWLPQQPPEYGVTVPESLPEDWRLLLPGEHNAENAALAVAALRTHGLDEASIKSGVESFSGVEGRLQLVKKTNEIQIYNDNNATTPNATAAAIKALERGRNLILICGGTDKKVNLGELPELIKKHVRHLVLYTGTGTRKLKHKLSGRVSREEHRTLAACVEGAVTVARPGDIILFSPAFSSFGKEYKNEYDRNDQFMKLVEEL